MGTKEFLLEYLKTHDSITVKDFQALTGKTSRGTFYNTIQSLEASGYKFVIVNDASKSKRYILTSTDNLSSYNPSSSDDFYKYMILETLNRNRDGMLLENPAKRASKRNRILIKEQQNDYKYLFDVFYDITCDPEDNNSIPINIGESKFRELLSDLENEGKITCTNEGPVGIVYRPNNNESLFTTKDLVNTLQILDQLPKKHKNYPILSNARDKISMELFHRSSFIDEDANFIVYGKKRRTFSSITSDLKILASADYKNYVIETKYNNEVLLFSVGKIVYSEISGEVYILGKRYAHTDKTSEYDYLKLSLITSVSTTKKKNTEYNNVVYDDICNHMLDISTNKPIHLKAKFVADYLPTTQKLNRLYSSRSNSAKILPIHEGDKHIASYYEDDISDLELIKPYLMGYGRACTVLEPTNMSEDIKQDIMAALDSYSKEGYDV